MSNWPSNHVEDCITVFICGMDSVELFCCNFLKTCVFFWASIQLIAKLSGKHKKCLSSFCPLPTHVQPTPLSALPPEWDSCYKQWTCTDTSTSPRKAHSSHWGSLLVSYILCVWFVNHSIFTALKLLCALAPSLSPAPGHKVLIKRKKIIWA